MGDNGDVRSVAAAMVASSKAGTLSNAKTSNGNLDQHWNPDDKDEVVVQPPTEDDLTAARLCDWTKPLAIDAFIESRFACRQPQVRPAFQRIEDATGKSAAFRVGRRAIEVAFWRASDAQKSAVGKDIANFDKAYDLASNAERALGSLLHFFVGNTITEADLARVLVTARNVVPGATAAEVHKAALSDAKSLLRARRVVDILSKSVRFKRYAISKVRKNAPHPDERAFAIVMSEAWAYLVDRRPGSNADPDKNPFVRFLQAAWRDAFPMNGRVFTALDAVQGHIPPKLAEPFRYAKPDWL